MRNRPFVTIAVVIIIGMIRSRPKSRNLDDFAAETYVREPETAPDQTAITKQSAHLFRRRIRRNVKVLRMQFQHCIAHAATHQEGLIARFVQPV